MPEIDPNRNAGLADALPAEGEAVLKDVRRVFNQLAGMDITLDDPGDLDRVRQALPTEPYRAQLVYAALPVSLREAVEYARPSDRRAGYWRRSRDRTTLSELSDAELKHRLAFSRAAKETREETGVVRTSDGRVISRAADEIGGRLAGKAFGDESTINADRGQDLFTQIVRKLK